MAGVTVALRIPNNRGYRLAADLLLPSGPGPFPAVICTHDPQENRDSPLYRDLAEVLLEQGMAVMLLDLTGQGQSEGSPVDGNADQQMEDVGVALEQLAGRPDIMADRVGAYGAGAGALPVVLRAERDPRLRSLVLRCPRSEGAFDALRRTALPTLLIVGAEDRAALEDALAIQEVLVGEKRVVVVPEIDCYPVDPERMRQASMLAADWFREHLA